MQNPIAIKPGVPADGVPVSVEQAAPLDSLRLPNALVRWLDAPLNPRQEGAVLQ